MTRVAIIAAMAGELKPLVENSRWNPAGRWPHSSRAGVHFWAQRGDKKNWEDEWIAACAGAGQAAAMRAFAGIEDGGPIDLVFSIGWAGALTRDLAPGSAHNMAGVIDTRTGERFHCEAGAGDLWLATSPRVAGREEKRRLAAAYGAALVDMEAAAIARLAAMRQIPFYCIKGISDGLDDRLPDFNPFLDAAGRFHAARFALSALPRPVYWLGLVRMGENSKRAARNIAATLHDFLA